MNTVPIDDLEYELRMLLGAAKQCQLFDEHDIGNPINYAKDSIYLHARNLYNFFSANTANDARVTKFTSHQFNLTFYGIWIDALHNHASHIKESRRTPTNVVNGDHLKDQVQKFASDIEGLWTDWINHTTDPQLKTRLKDALKSARQEAQDDYDSLKKRIVPAS